VDEHHAVYSELYREYVRLHDLLGRDPDSVMKRLRAIRQRSREEVGIA
jgi:ribulose kinase